MPSYLSRKLSFSIFLLYLFTSSILAVEEKSIYDMDLLELSKLSYSDTFSLTKTSERDIPYSFTRITREMIDHSGARSLDELLGIYVPSLNSLYHGSTSRRFVLRGIVSNDSILLLVNGRVMNERVLLGAFSERHLSMLGDIEQIEVIRGPGAALHGAGSISGVISITTFNGKSFEGMDINFRQGFFEQFTSGELRLGEKIDDENSLFFYYGIDKYQGSPAKYSPFVVGSQTGVFAEGERVNSGIVNQNQAYRDKPRHKLHLQFDGEHNSTWIRYTRSGIMQQRLGSQGIFAGGNGSHQLTLFTEFNYELMESLDWQLRLSYDWLDFSQLREDRILNVTGNNPEATNFYLTQEFYLRNGFNWSPYENHHLALFYEFSNERQGDNNIGWPHLAVEDRWTFYVHSLLSEYQWQINDRWTSFISLRADKHSLIEHELLSQRSSLIYKPSDKDTWKFSYSYTERRSDENDVRVFEVSTTEVINYFELSYGHQFDNGWLAQTSAYYALYDIINFSDTTRITEPLGTVEFFGLEQELKYTGDNLHAIFSVGLSKLLNFRVIDPSKDNSISSEPQGAGEDFYEVPLVIAKTQLAWKFNNEHSVDGSLLFFSGDPGKEDLEKALRGNEISGASDRYSLYLNLGYNWTIDDNSKLRVDAHNILGLIDDDINRRSYRGKPDYSIEAPALSVSYLYSF